jgi:hypothetical protein
VIRITRRSLVSCCCSGVLTCIFAGGSPTTALAGPILQFVQPSSVITIDQPAATANADPERSSTESLVWDAAADVGAGYTLPPKLHPSPYAMTRIASTRRAAVDRRWSVSDSVGWSIPEPVTLTLFGAGLVALGVVTARRRRRHRTAALLPN